MNMKRDSGHSNRVKTVFQPQSSINSFVVLDSYLFHKKKRKLSNNSNDGQDTKKWRKTSSLSFEKASNEDVFTDSLKSGDCILILKRCMENIKKEMESLYVAKKIRTKLRLKVNFNWQA